PQARGEATPVRPCVRLRAAADRDGGRDRGRWADCRGGGGGRRDCDRGRAAGRALAVLCRSQAYRHALLWALNFPRDEAMATKVLDVKGLNCPLPILRVKKAIKDVA